LRKDERYTYADYAGWDWDAGGRHELTGGEYITRAYAGTDTGPVHVPEGCVITIGDVFAE